MISLNVLMTLVVKLTEILTEIVFSQMAVHQHYSYSLFLFPVNW